MNFFRFLRRKKKEEEAVKPEVKIVEREFPGISVMEQKKYIGKHVAIVEGKIIASAGTAKGALDDVSKLSKDQKLLAAATFIVFLLCLPIPAG